VARPTNETKRTRNGWASPDESGHAAWACNDGADSIGGTKAMDGRAIRPYHLDKCFPSAFTPPGSEYIFFS
jgi:hypothetical protein